MAKTTTEGMNERIKYLEISDRSQDEALLTLKNKIERLESEINNLRYGKHNHTMEDFP